MLCSQKSEPKSPSLHVKKGLVIDISEELSMGKTASPFKKMPFFSKNEVGPKAMTNKINICQNLELTEKNFFIKKFKLLLKF